MAYRIRRSKISDTEILGQIHSRAWQDTYIGLMPANLLARAGSVERRTAIRRDMFTNTTPDWGHFLVENEADEVVGFGDCGPAHQVKDFAEAEIYTLYLLQSAQKQGWGKQLMRHMLSHLAERSFKKAALNVLATNETALQFYQKLGGQEVSRKTVDFLGTTLPEAVYAWPDLKMFAERQGS